ncbi:MAG: CBS domain-containing protein [Desulfobacteraceae bacterium]|jgi:CBS domain-containing protein|nr:CBS domain-containing protein [Desulfobacteraceae bacterium]
MKRLTAKDVMNEDVLSVGMDWSVEYLTDFLVENGISGAPVTSEDGKLVGVVSLTDIVRHNSLPGKDSRLNSPYDYYRHGLEHQYAKEDIRSLSIETEPLDTVRDIMTPMIFDVNEDTKVKQVADTMIRGRIHRVFVTREQKLAGVITTVDMLKVIRNS